MSIFGTVSLGLITNYLYNRFSSDTTTGNKMNKEILKRIKRIEEDLAKQGKTITEEELIKANKELKKKLKKEAVAIIPPELQTELDQLFTEYRYEEFRNKIDTFRKENENIKQKDLAELYYQKALTYEAEINYTNAKEEFETALALDRENSNILNQYGIILYKISQYDKAIKYYKKALKIDLKTLGDEHPNVATRYNNLGSAWDSKGEYDKAIEYYKKALKIDLKALGDEHPGTATDYNNLGLVWYSKGEYDKAIEYYKKALGILRKVHPNGHLHVDTVEKHLEMARQKKGIDL